MEENCDVSKFWGDTRVKSYHLIEFINHVLLLYIILIDGLNHHISQQDTNDMFRLYLFCRITCTTNVQND